MTTDLDLDKAIHEQVIAAYEMYARFADQDNDHEKAAEYRERAEMVRTGNV